MSPKTKNNLIGICILIGSIAAINLYLGSPDWTLRNNSLREMVEHSLSRFHGECQRLWEEKGPQENCTLETTPEILKEYIDLPGIYISGEGNQEHWQATARHEILMNQVYQINGSGNLAQLK